MPTCRESQYFEHNSPVKTSNLPVLEERGQNVTVLWVKTVNLPYSEVIVRAENQPK